jgi:putative hydrolase of the HAD superfamily
MSIDTLVFDLGGVILPLNLDKWRKDFESVHPEAFNEIYPRLAKEDFFDLYEAGKIEDEPFLQRLEAELGASREDTERAWNGLFEPILPSSLEYLQELRSRYRLLLLSNTNVAHYRWIRAHLEELGFAEYGGVFETQFLSFELLCRKPEKEIFDKVRGLGGLQDGRFVFIEDTPENLDGAEAAGWQVIRYPRNAPLAETLPTYLENLD